MHQRFLNYTNYTSPLNANSTRKLSEINGKPISLSCLCHYWQARARERELIEVSFYHLLPIESATTKHIRIVVAKAHTRLDVEKYLLPFASTQPSTNIHTWCEEFVHQHFRGLLVDWTEEKFLKRTEPSRERRERIQTEIEFLSMRRDKRSFSLLEGKLLMASRMRNTSRVFVLKQRQQSEMNLLSTTHSSCPPSFPIQSPCN